MPTRPIRLPGSFTGRRGPVDAGHVHWCSESCVHVTVVDRVIVEQIAQGKTNQQIARSLNQAEPTVRNRLSRIMRKLGVQSRTEIAVLALQAGLLKVS